MVTYTVENELDTIGELDDLGMLEQNFMEVDPRGLSSSFELNWELVDQLLSLGIMQVAVARNDYGKPVGYIIMNVVPNDLFCNEKIASSVCMFIDQEYRRGIVFFKLIKLMEKHLLSLGVKHYTVGVLPEGFELSNHGYHLDNKIYSKTLTHSIE